MTKSNFLKVTSFFLVLPFVNIHFNNLVRPSNLSSSFATSPLNILTPDETHQHSSCFIPHFDQEEAIMVFETPDFGKEMGKYIKDNFGNKEGYKIKTIVVDAGHGGRDRGTSGKYIIEKDIALNIALRLGANLAGNFPNIRVLYTRTDDRFIPLNERAGLANDNKADLFISIHCNFLEDGGRVKGSETYVMGLHTATQNLNVAKRENASILYEQNYQQQYDGYDPNSPEGHIILSMYQNAYLGQSILLADKIEQKIATGAGRKSRGVKQAGFVVLKQTTMPSVLVEAGYLSNADDERYLASEAGQSNMAMSILEAFVAYKQEVEENNGGATSIAEVEANMEQLKLSSTRIKVDQKKLAKKATTPKPVPDETASVNPVSKGMAPALMVKNKKENTLSKEEIEATEYKVLLASSSKLLDTSKSPWKDVDYSVQVLREENQYKYLVIGFKKREDATKVKHEMRKNGFPGAFVLAYRNGQRIREHLPKKSGSK